MKNSQSLLFTVFNKFVQILATESQKNVQQYWAHFKPILQENPINYPLAFEYISKIHQENLLNKNQQTHRQFCTKYKWNKKNNKPCDLKTSSSYSSQLRVNQLTTPINLTQRQQYIANYTNGVLLASASSNNSNIINEKNLDIQLNQKVIKGYQFIRKLNLSNEQTDNYLSIFKKFGFLYFNNYLSFMKSITIGFFINLLKDSHKYYNKDSIWQILYQCHKKTKIVEESAYKNVSRNLSMILSTKNTNGSIYRQIKTLINLCTNEEQFVEDLMFILKQKINNIIDKNPLEKLNDKQKRNRLISLNKINWNQYKPQLSNLFSQTLEKIIQIHIINRNAIEQFNFTPLNSNQKNKIIIFYNKQQKYYLLAINQSQVFSCKSTILQSLNQKQYKQIINICQKTLNHQQQNKPIRNQSVNTSKSTKNISNQSPLFLKYGIPNLVSQKKQRLNMQSPKMNQVNYKNIQMHARQLLQKMNKNSERLMQHCKGKIKEKESNNIFNLLYQIYPLK